MAAPVAAPEAARAFAGACVQARAEASAENRLATLARAAGPLRRVLAALATRLVDGPGGNGGGEKGWERLGYARLADYARERLGVSARKARALRRLERLGEGCPAPRRGDRRGSPSGHTG